MNNITEQIKGHLWCQIKGTCNTDMSVGMAYNFNEACPYAILKWDTLFGRDNDYKESMEFILPREN